jgi:hypothetical protein
MNIRRIALNSNRWRITLRKADRNFSINAASNIAWQRDSPPEK